MLPSCTILNARSCKGKVIPASSESDPNERNRPALGLLSLNDLKPFPRGNLHLASDQQDRNERERFMEGR